MKINNVDFNSVNKTIVLNIDKILAYFGIEYRKNENCVSIKCPIHGSSKISLNIFTSGDKKLGNFVCWTKHCEYSGDSSVYVIKSLLEKKHSRDFSINETVSFLRKELKLEISDAKKEERNDFLDWLPDAKDEDYSKNISRNIVRSYLQIPSPYYISRGFRKSILEKFDVGTCYKREFLMYSRVVVPIYDISGSKFVGCVGRSQNEECPLCGCYHRQDRTCPNDEYRGLWAKWTNSKGLKSGNHLYGIWTAKEAIQERNSVILVEGQGDVWKANQIGKENVLGLFGDCIKNKQLKILNRLGVMNVYLALDNDNAGKIGTKKIKEVLKDYFNVYTVKYSGKDIGETEESELKKVFKGI